LENFLITSFSTIGDSSFEIDAFTLEQANRAAFNDKLILAYLQEMQDLHDAKKKLQQPEMSIKELNSYLHMIADRSNQIGGIIKLGMVSYLTMRHVQKEVEKYRPSRYGLQVALKKYLEEELTRGPKADDQMTIDSRVRYVKIESVLDTDMIKACLKKIDFKDFDLLVVYNKYRNIYILYSKDDDLKKDGKAKQYIDEFEKKLSKEGQLKLLESKNNFRILRLILV
jgi:hypothetical protein